MAPSLHLQLHQLLELSAPCGVGGLVVWSLGFLHWRSLSCLSGCPGFDYHFFPSVLWLFRGTHPLEMTREATYSSLVFHMCHHLRLLTSFFEASFSADRIFGQRFALR